MTLQRMNGVSIPVLARTINSGGVVVIKGGQVLAIPAAEVLAIGGGFAAGGSVVLVQPMMSESLLGDVHPQTGNKILAEVVVKDPIDVKVEAAKPAINGKLGKLHRYENPGTHDPTCGRNPYDHTKSVLPKDHLELFNRSVEVNGVRYSIDSQGFVHQFQNSIDNVFHWAGSQNGATLRRVRVPLSVPSGVVKALRAYK